MAELVLGDVTEWAERYAARPDFIPFTAGLSDPPYGLGFMGKAWDHGVPSAYTWAALRACMAPGAWFLAFGGSRTFHRLAVNMEDGGFEIVDVLSWLYGSGFPKSYDIAKGIDGVLGTQSTGAVYAGYDQEYAPRDNTKRHDYGYRYESGGPGAAWLGYGTALKPAWEPLILARNPRPPGMTIKQAAQEYGAGGLNIDGERIATGDNLSRINGAGAATWGTYGNGANRAAQAKATGIDLGRWPANVILDGEAARMLDEQAQANGRGQGAGGGPKVGVRKAGTELGQGSGWNAHTNRDTTRTTYGDGGGPSRYFYVPKANRKERDYGLEDFPELSGGQATDRQDDSPGTRSPRAGAGRLGGARNPHPTVKPLDLIRHVAALIRPPVEYLERARLLVPFSGSGSEIIGAMLGGWNLGNITGIEKEPDYIRIAQARIAAWDRRYREEQELARAFGPLFAGQEAGQDAMD